MKKITAAAALILLISCSQKDAGTDNSGANSTSNVEEHSGENISPQLNRENDERLGVDTISSANEANKAKEGDLD